MKIVLVEERDGKSPSEKSFVQPLIKIGRDPNTCQIVFAQADYPMVSRNHAELRWANGVFLLHDSQSSYGTYLNGYKVTSPIPLQTGMELQFGTNGPKMRILTIETAENSRQEFGSPVINREMPPAPAPHVEKPAYQPDMSGNLPPLQPKLPTPVAPNPTPFQPANYAPQPANINAAPPKRPVPPADDKVFLEFLNSVNPRYSLQKDSITLGREPNCEVVMDANAVMVSRRHAEIRRENGHFVLHDKGSFNGTLVNEQRITAPTPLYDGDKIQLGQGGPLLKFIAPAMPAPLGAELAGQRSVIWHNQSAVPGVNGQISMPPVGQKTMVFKSSDVGMSKSPNDSEGELLFQLAFNGKNELNIGRSNDNDISLDGLQISNKHAKLSLSNSGVSVEDVGSTNGIYIGGKRISRQLISPAEAVQIGAFVIRVDQANNVYVFDTRSKTRIDSLHITKEVKNRSGGGKLKLLDDVSLTIQPNEFVGLLGPSGAGKSTFMDALNGMRPASSGNVLINNLDFYEHLDALKQSIGYVPQDDIIHRELTVYRTLYYVAKLRLSSDVSSKELDQIVGEVMDVTGLTERRDVPISQLSGGQRKRVSIAVELVTKPSVIFLDEPTSGLDPATEEKIMKLFRQIAESGRTVILTTHAMENVKLFDKIVVLMRGKLVFYGKPEEALKHLKADSFKDLYDRLEAPIDEKFMSASMRTKDAKELKKLRADITEEVAESWKNKFQQTPQYRSNVLEPLSKLKQSETQTAPRKRNLGIVGAVRQTINLSRRYLEVLSRDKLNLFILFAQAPIVALLTFIVMDKDLPRDSIYFVLSLVAVWFGTSVAAREIIRERPVYNRERMVNLGLLPYVTSKLFVLSLIVGLQCLMLFVPLKFFHFTTLMPMPGVFGGIPQFFVMFLTALVGIALGLFISAIVKTSEMATSIVPLILIPQILFSGLFGIPYGISRVASLTMPASWSFDTMKRFSDLDVLREDGDRDNKNDCTKKNPCGLYKRIERENDQIIADAKTDLDTYKNDAQKDMDDYKDDMKSYLKNVRQGISGDEPKQPTLKSVPQIKDAKKVPQNLSGYVDFHHPWMHELANQIVLLLMFFGLFLGTLIALKMQDIG